MNWPDIDNAAALYRQGVLPLKAVAWAIARFRQQENGTLSAADLMKLAGASKTAAYRTVAEFRLVSAAPQEPISDSRISGVPLSRKAGKTVPEIGNPPTPPYKETEKRRDRHKGAEKFPICGNRKSDGVSRAVAILGENLQTDPLSDYLSRNSHLPEVRALAEDTGDGRYPPGWRLESAALQFLSPRIPDDVRGCRNLRASLSYFLSVARGLRSPYVPPSMADAGYRATGTEAGPGHPPAPRRPNRPDFRAMFPTSDDTNGEAESE